LVLTVFLRSKVSSYVVILVPCHFSINYLIICWQRFRSFQIFLQNFCQPSKSRCNLTRDWCYKTFLLDVLLSFYSGISAVWNVLHSWDIFWPRILMFHYLQCYTIIGHYWPIMLLFYYQTLYFTSMLQFYQSSYCFINITSSYVVTT